MLITAPLFVGWWIAGARYLMADDPTIDEKWRWRDWLPGCSPGSPAGPWNFLVTVPLRYMRPQPPSRPEANTQMALDYLEYSPAARDARERAAAHGRQWRIPCDRSELRTQQVATEAGGGPMKVAVDLDTCDGNGVCMSICHEVFDVREDGLHLLQDAPPDELRKQAEGRRSVLSDPGDHGQGLTHADRP